MKVYIVTSGTYSDYHIDGVFSTRQRAQVYAKELERIGADDGDGCCIEPWTLDEFAEHRACAVWHTRMSLRTGFADQPRTGQDVAPPGKRGATKVVTSMKEVQATSYVSAEHAVKLAAEARQRYMRKHGLPFRTAEEMVAERKQG